MFTQPINTDSVLCILCRFHQLNHRKNKAGNDFLKTNCLRSPIIKAMSKDPKVMRLADKLYRCAH